MCGLNIKEWCQESRFSALAGLSDKGIPIYFLKEIMMPG